MTLDFYPSTPLPPSPQSPNFEYSTEPDQTDDYPDKPEDQNTQRVNKKFERPVDPPGIPDESISENPEKPTERPEELTERPEEPPERPEELTERPEEPTERQEYLTERPEEPPERPEEPTEGPEEFIEIPIEPIETPEESQRIDKTDKYGPRTPEYAVEFKESNKYDEVTYKRPKINISPPPVEEFTSEPPYSTFKPLINNVPRRVPPNKTFTIRKQEITKESKVYVDSSFQEVSSKFKANVFYV